MFYINTNELPNHFTLIVFWCERSDLLSSHSNGDIFTCEDNMLFSHVKISSFRAKTHLVFHWCLYNKAIYLLYLESEGCPILWQIILCMVLYCLHLTILYKSITIKEQSKTMINLTRLCMNLLGYWTSMCNQCLGKCYHPFDCEYSRYHKKSIQ